MTIPEPGQGWTPEAIEAIAPRHLDYGRMRRLVAALVTSDGPGIADVMNEAALDGGVFRLLTAAGAQLGVDHRLDDPENLAVWRQGILYHLQQSEDDQTHE